MPLLLDFDAEEEGPAAETAAFLAEAAGDGAVLLALLLEAAVVAEDETDRGSNRGAAKPVDEAAGRASVNCL